MNQDIGTNIDSAGPINHRESLISIIVITYNSAKYVLETLESAKAQTYKNIELIISDDYSTDNTVEICRKWIEENRSRFVRTELITSENNSGIPANCNRGVNAAQGVWVKLIAGDDIMCEKCIKENIEFANRNNEAHFIFSKGSAIDDKSMIIGEIGSNISKMNLNCETQYKELLKSAFVLTPSAFMRKETVLKLGGYNEEILLMEDYPLWLKATKNGYKLFYLDCESVLYRIHAGSSSEEGKTPLKNVLNRVKWMNTILHLYDEDTMKDIRKFKMIRKYYHIKLLKKSFRAYLKGDYLNYYFFSIVRFLDPVYLLKTVYKLSVNFSKFNTKAKYGIG